MNRALSLFLVICVLAAADVSAQATRTWVSGVGDDVNPCSRTAPCKTFAGAISKTAAGGEIDALDPGGFGAVTITKSITIDGGPGAGGILAAGTTGVTISGAGITVVLRNLNFLGVSAATFGVRVLNAASVQIENCTIQGFTRGIDFQPSAANTSLYVNNTTLMNNDPTNLAGGMGILIKPVAGQVATAVLNNVRMHRNNAGIRIEDGAKVVARSSTASNNLNGGFVTLSSGTSGTELTMDECQSLHNGTGVKLDTTGPQVFVRLSRTLVSGNATGLATTGGLSAHMVSQITNWVLGNGANGAFTETAAQQ